VVTQDLGYPISYAALKNGHDNAAKLIIIERGANFNKLKLIPRSVVEVAIASSCSKAVEAMIERGADVVSRADEWGLSPLAMAVYHREMAIERLLIEKGATKSDFSKTYKI
jgi:ankyrin repeat protein